MTLRTSNRRGGSCIGGRRYARDLMRNGCTGRGLHARLHGDWGARGTLRRAPVMLGGLCHGCEVAGSLGVMLYYAG